MYLVGEDGLQTKLQNSPHQPRTSFAVTLTIIMSAFTLISYIPPTSSNVQLSVQSNIYMHYDVSTSGATNIATALQTVAAALLVSLPRRVLQADRKDGGLYTWRSRQMH